MKTEEGKKKTQIGDVLGYLKKHGSITSMEAFEKFHATRLASIIFRLRKHGYDIRTETCNGANQYGTYQYALYILEDPDNEVVSN